MSSSLNSVQLIGNVGVQPEIKNTNSGKSMATFSIATSESWRGKDGKSHENTEWHKIVVFGALADKVVQPYVNKGDKLYIKGKLQTRKWTDNNGVDRYTTEILLSGFGSELIMLGSPRGSDNSQPSPPSQPKREFSTRDLDDDVPF